jgi:hypothetical protein
MHNLHEMSHCEVQPIRRKSRSPIRNHGSAIERLKPAMRGLPSLPAQRGQISAKKFAH